MGGLNSTFCCCHSGCSNLCDEPCNCLRSDEDQVDNHQDIVSNTDDSNTNDYENDRRGAVLFYMQIALLTVVVFVSVVHLSLQNGDQTLWTGTLSTAIGILLPQPRFPIFRSRLKNGKRAKDTSKAEEVV